jgi:hypothetical protein
MNDGSGSGDSSGATLRLESGNDQVREGKKGGKEEGKRSGPRTEEIGKEVEGK